MTIPINNANVFSANNEYSCHSLLLMRGNGAMDSNTYSCILNNSPRVIFSTFLGTQAVHTAKVGSGCRIFGSSHLLSTIKTLSQWILMVNGLSKFHRSGFETPDWQVDNAYRASYNSREFA